MEDVIIRFKGVSKSFGKKKIFDLINLDIPRGKITGILGASGEGKSTLLKMMISFYKPSNGTIYYSGKEILKNLYNLKEDFGIAIEDGSFYENLTVRENLFHFGRLYHVDNKTLKKRVEGMLYFVGLENSPHVLAKNLSLGMKKRLDIACALIHKPSVLILDEPTADLDPLLRYHLLHLIKKINAHGTTVIFTTQLMEEVEQICDKIAILSNQKIVEQGSPDLIKKKYNSSDMNKVFEKIFSKNRKNKNSRLSDKKTQIVLSNKEEESETLFKEENSKKKLSVLLWIKNKFNSLKKNLFKRGFIQKKNILVLNKEKPNQKSLEEKGELNKDKEIK